MRVSLNYLNVENNNLSKVPTVLGFMKLSGLKIDGNPLKLIKRAVIDKGTVAILDYLRTKHSGNLP
jgi:Leucine-rich repeat (LRR) protein